MHSRIEELWQQHLDAPFPANCRCKKVAGWDLIMLDADSAGCISTFIDRGGKLDMRRLAGLGLCYHRLALVSAELTNEARDYFRRLETLAELVLTTIGNNTSIE